MSRPSRRSSYEGALHAGLLAGRCVVVYVLERREMIIRRQQREPVINKQLGTKRQAQRQTACGPTMTRKASVRRQAHKGQALCVGVGMGMVVSV